MGATTKMRIIRMDIDAYKGIRAVTLKPNGQPLVTIEGKNGAGKSSVLDAVMAVFSKGAGADKPIRDGFKAAKVRIDAGAFVADMKITPSGKSIEVTGADGKPIPRPSEFLTGLVGKLFADPLAFIHLAPREQVALLQRLTGLDERFAEIDRRKREALDGVNGAERSLKLLDAQIAAIPPVPAGPDEPVSSDQLRAALTKAREQAEKVRQAKTWLAGREQRVKALTEQIRALQAELAVVQGEIDGVQGQAALRAEMPDVADLERELDELAETNAAASTRATLKRLRAQRQEAEKERLENSRAVDAAEADRRIALEAARLPVPGLTFDEDGLRLDGIPFGQVNTAAQLRVGVVMALASNPALRLVLVRNGSLLDSDGFKALHYLMVEYDAQAIVERTTDGAAHAGGWTIVDGELAEGGAQ